MGNTPENPNKKKINAYVCENLHITITKDIHEGTTPMYIPCPDCERNHKQVIARTQMYLVNQAFEATHEWYKPTHEEIAKMQADIAPTIFSNILQHINQGGLLIREKNKTKLWLPRR